MITPLSIAVADQGNDLWAEPDAESIFGTRAPPTNPLQMILDHAMLRAAANGDADRVEQLIGAGADLEARNMPNSPHGDHSRTALHIAAWETHTQVCQVLLDLRADYILHAYT